MESSNKTCSYFEIDISEHNISFLHGIGIPLVLFSLLSNIIATLGTWKMNISCSSRSSKLLIYQFVVYILVTLDVVLPYAYPYLTYQSLTIITSVHLPSVMFLTLLGSSNQVLLSIDRFLLLRRGKSYKNWKDAFTSVIISVIISCLCISLYFWYLLDKRCCDGVRMALILQGSVVFICLLISISFNVIMLLYLKKNLTRMRSHRSRLKRKISQTMITITVASAICEIIHIIVSGTIALLSRGTFLEKGYFLLGGLFLVNLLKCGIYPFIYLIRNFNIARNIF